MKLFGQVLKFLFKFDKRKLYILITSLFVTSLLEVASVAMVLPLLKQFSEGGGQLKMGDYVIGMSVDRFALIVLILLLISNGVLIFSVFLNNRLGLSIGFDISSRVYQYYLDQELIWFKKQNLNDLISRTFNESNRFAMNVIVQLLEAIGRTMTNIIIFVVLLIAFPIPSLVLLTVFGLLFFVVSKYIRPIVYRNGQAVTKLNRSRIALLNSSFQGIIELKVFNISDLYAKEFRKQSMKYSALQASNQSLQRFPRYLIEFAGFGLLIGFGVFILNYYPDSNLLSSLYAFGLAAYKLLPGFQLLYSASTKVRANIDSFFYIRNELNAILQKREHNENSGELRVNDLSSIAVDDLDFSYDQSHNIFKGFNCLFEAGRVYKLTGPSGRGKSTLISILCGLHESVNDKLSLNGESIKKYSIESYRRNIGYVPQAIFLFNDSVKANVFVDEKSYDNMIFKQLISVLNLSDVLAKYEDQPIGDNGNLLSGGQKQRVGILRAMARGPKFIVLDESTSGLNSELEIKFFNWLSEYVIKESAICLFVSHNESLDKYADDIIVI